MTEAPASAPSVPSATAAPDSALPPTALPVSPKAPRSTIILIAVIAGLALVSALLWQKLERIQEDLARRSQDASTAAIEARTLARQALDTVREATGRQALLETRLSEVALQRSQLEELMQSLSRSRDENLVVDIDSALRLAQQQAQLTGSVEPLLAALKTADQRIARAAQPRLTPLQRALARDVDRIKATTVSDTPSLLVKLDELARSIDDLPLANAVGENSLRSTVAQAAPSDAEMKAALTGSTPAAGSAAGTALGAAASGLGAEFKASLHSALARVQNEARKLLRVSRIEQPEAALLSPEQGFFLRENLKLKLLNARLALLARQPEASRADLAAATAALGKYFDANARKTQAAAGLLQGIQAQMKNVDLPRLDASLTALATAAAGR